jgi:hypothetical protein
MLGIGVVTMMEVTVIVSLFVFSTTHLNLILAVPSL